MTASGLQAAVLVLTLASAAIWGIAASRSHRGSIVPPGPVLIGIGLISIGLTSIGVLLTAVRIVAMALLWTQGWWFVEEKVALGLPLSLLAVAAVVACSWRDRAARQPTSALTRTGLFAAAYAAGAELALQVVIGYPLSLLAGGTVLVVVVGGTVATWLALTSGPRRLGNAITATLAIIVLGALAATWISAGSQPALATNGHHSMEGHSPAKAEPVSVTELRAPAGPAQVTVDLEAGQQTVQLPSGRNVDAWTFGALPGRNIEANEGDLIEVRLRNRDITSGVTLHWHGYDVPNGEDGVAGVTQDAVMPGESFVYRFVADRPGSYWYHTHQRSSDGVVRGLYGTLVVHPRAGASADIDLVLPFHTINQIPLLGGSDVLERRTVKPGQSVRVRFANTDQVPHVITISGSAYRVLAIDGTDLLAPGLLTDRAIRVPAGGRYDIGFDMPDTPVRLSVQGATATGMLFEVNAGGAVPPLGESAGFFDPLTYGVPGETSEMSGPYDVDRTMVLDRLPRIHNGLPGYAYTVDGLVFPHIPPTEVREGDLVHLRVVNRGFESHPMHPHGHHVLVLSVNGQAPTGSPIWLDTFDVQPGEVWEVAFRADNPGIWMDHCHNLNHAARGMVTHLAYENVHSPYSHGGPTGNEPE